MNDFAQRIVPLSNNDFNNKLQVKKLLSLIKNHSYKEELIKLLNVESFINDFIVIDNINIAFEAVKAANEKYEKINASAALKDIYVETTIDEGEAMVEFCFEQCRIDDELKEGLSAKAIYSSKDSFFNEYNMAKYANFLIDVGESELLKQNVEHFKRLASQSNEDTKYKSYRLLHRDSKYFLRGITSERYNEYGIDFTFFTIVMLVHTKMKKDIGSNYSITFLSLNESKLDMVIKDNRSRKVEHFGTVSHGIEISTNELGNGSLNIASILRIENNHNETLLYLLPKDKPELKTKLEVNHITNLKKVLEKVKEFEKLLSISQETVDEIKDIRGLKHPDELRVKIQSKIEQPNSIFKNVRELKDIFSKPIRNEISNFSVLLELCGKIEALEIDYDIKDKLRYIISDIILYGSASG